jgi:methionine sulfoxide reductase heme-binding subunit
MRAIRVLKPTLIVALCVPFLALVLGVLQWPGGYRLGANPVNFVIDELGLWGLRFLLATLILTPLRELSHDPDWLRLRRTLGLSAFAYLSVHLLFYVGVDLRFSLKGFLDDVRDYPWILVGTAGLVGMIPLAITSTDRWLRRLKQRWKQLHRIVYVAALLGCWHFFWQVKKDKTEPLVYGAVFVGLMVLRLPAVTRALRRVF